MMVSLSEGVEIEGVKIVKTSVIKRKYADVTIMYPIVSSKKSNDL